MNICLVITVLNEADHIHRLFDSVLLQTRLPDEIIVCDAGSKDNTVTILSKYSNKLPLRILVYDGANISTGRNVAIEAAQSEIIAVTDAGVTLSPSWLENLTSSFTDEKIMHVAGFFNTDSDTTFEKAMGAKWFAWIFAIAIIVANGILLCGVQANSIGNAPDK